MLITYLFREPRSGIFSIEELFGNISKEVSQQHQVHNFYCKSADRYANVRDVRKLVSDIYHITGDVNYLSYGLPTSKTVLTVHDLGHFEKTLKGYKKLIYKQLWLNLPFRKVHKITTISEFTKERLMHHFKLPDSKIEVIHNPAPLQIFKRSDKEQMASLPKILQIGGGHNKNVDHLIEAVKGLEVELVLLRKEDPRLTQKMDALSIRYTYHPLLSYEQVYEKYIEADMLYFASNYEGFGVPILEAQAVGRPLITSTVASMPEVAGQGAHFVDYKSVADIRAAILKIIGNADYRKGLIEKGFENVQKFTLANTVSKYIKLYESIHG